MYVEGVSERCPLVRLLWIHMGSWGRFYEPGKSAHASGAGEDNCNLSQLLSGIYVQYIIYIYVYIL